jgi:pimeloyl-ACP methyl ester carboxylesterase
VWREAPGGPPSGGKPRIVSRATVRRCRAAHPALLAQGHLPAKREGKPRLDASAFLGFMPRIGFHDNWTCGMGDLTPHTMRVSFTTPDGTMLSGIDTGEGLPVVFQHGLTGDAAQVAEVFPDRPVLRRLTLECRGHGGSEPGDRGALGFGQFAADLLAFMAARGVSRAIVGGISMGAGLALRLAVQRPDVVSALILARPAWLFDVAPETLAPFREVGRLVRQLGPVDGKRAFAASAICADLAIRSPDNLVSLMAVFDRPDGDRAALLAEAIGADGPGVTEEAVVGLRLPVLILANEADVIHPVAYARRLAELIPGAQLALLPPKGSDRAGHVAAFRAEVARFITGLLPAQSG